MAGTGQRREEWENYFDARQPIVESNPAFHFAGLRVNCLYCCEAQ